MGILDMMGSALVSLAILAVFAGLFRLILEGLAILLTRLASCISLAQANAQLTASRCRSGSPEYVSCRRREIFLRATILAATSVAFMTFASVLLMFASRSLADVYLFCGSFPLSIGLPLVFVIAAVMTVRKAVDDNMLSGFMPVRFREAFAPDGEMSGFRMYTFEAVDQSGKIVEKPEGYLHYLPNFRLRRADRGDSVYLLVEVMGEVLLVPVSAEAEHAICTH